MSAELPLMTPQQVREQLLARREIALLDVRAELRAIGTEVQIRAGQTGQKTEQPNSPIGQSNNSQNHRQDQVHKSLHVKIESLDC